MIPSAALPPLDDDVTLSELGVDNLRALRMEQPIELRRLMLLVGRNGIGKSTLARVFPLLRQSAGSRTREPLLWWERDQVDFGSFGESLRRGAEDMTFTFGFMDRGGVRWRACSTLCKADNEGCRVRRVAVEQDDHEVVLHFAADGTLAVVEGSLAGERFRHAEPGARSEPPPLPPLTAEPWKLFAVPSAPEDPTVMLDLMEGVFHGNTDISTRRWVALGLPWSNVEEIAPALEAHHFGKKYQAQVKRLRRSPKRLEALQRARFCWWALERLRQAEALVEEFAQRTAYLGPFRAVPERTYRPQGVAVEQLDPRGSNLAMFLAALRPGEHEQLNSYLDRSLEFRVTTKLVGGHYSLQIELGREGYNLLDVGFGYSQMLPVAVQLWASGRMLSTSRSRIKHSTIVIEQPELHLHPFQQVLMARALADIAAADEGPVQLIETHSDHLVGEIGMQVARGRLSPERVGVLCIEPHSESGATVRLATFDEDGVLQNWPAGFLAP